MDEEEFKSANEYFVNDHDDHINNDDAVRSLIQGAISMIKKVVKKKGMNDLEVQ